jgi:transcription factor C subunit 6
MLEQFLPQERPSMNQGNKPKQKAAETAPPISTGAWPSQVGVNKVTWNSGNGLGGASLLASATASGLCRVDWLEGRWLRDKVPYVSVENIRREGGNDEGELSPADDDD